MGALPGQRSLDFPLLHCPTEHADNSLDALLKSIEQHNSRIKDLVVRHGAVLFRGWAVKDGKNFASVVEALGYKNMPYENGGLGVRRHVHGPVFTSNEAPLDIEISFHNECTYLPNYPDIIMFFCEEPSSEAGETGIVYGKEVYKRLQRDLPEFLHKLEKHKLEYSGILPKKWETTDKAVAQDRAGAIHARLEWRDDGQVLVHRGLYAPVLKHPLTGNIAWFNSICLIYDQTPEQLKLQLGDGSSLSTEEIQALKTILREEQFVIDWQRGDFVIIDNLSVMHSRLPGKLPRSVLVAMAKTA